MLSLTKKKLVLLGVLLPAVGLLSVVVCHILAPRPDAIDLEALGLYRETGDTTAPGVIDPDPPESDMQLIGSLRDRGNRGIWDLALTPDGKVLATVCGDGTVKLWDLERRQLIAATLTGHDNSDGPVAVSADGKSLAWGRNNGQVQLWDLGRKIETLCLRGHSDRITALSFSPDGALLASASRDQDVRVWELARPVKKVKLASEMKYPTSLSFSTDGHRLACAGMANFVRVWDLPSGAESALLRVDSDSTCVAYTRLFFLMAHARFDGRGNVAAPVEAGLGQRAIADMELELSVVFVRVRL